MQDFKNKIGIGANKRTFGFLSLLVAIPVVIGLISFVQQKNQKDPQVLAANQASDLLEKVGKLMDVPDETPTIATVSDVAKLANQEFFAKAKNGDKVIIFPNAQKAILYRPTTDKIIEVAFYTPPDSSAQDPAISVPVTPTPTAGISLRDLVSDPTTRPSISPAPTSARVSPQPSLAP